MKRCWQKKRIDYGETFSSVARYESDRLIISIVSALDLHMVQFDFKTVFPDGDLNEPIYIDQPYCFVEDENLVCLLKRSLYGLNQASRQWNLKIMSFLTPLNPVQSHADPCIFVYKNTEFNILTYSLNFK